MIIHTHKAIFVHIPKTAGSSIEVALNTLENTNKGAVDEATGTFYPVTTGKEKHYDARAYRKHYGRRVWQDYYKFTVVRNPWQRIHSWWWNNRYITGKFDMPFAEFLHSHLAEFLHSRFADPDDLPRALRPQTRWITSANGNIEMDYICRFETIDKDFKTVCEQIGAPLTELPRVLVDNRNPASRPYYTDDYDADLVDLVARVYSEDIRQLQYTFGDKADT